MKRPEFTYEQELWICDVVGDWYVYWKDRLCQYEDKTHKLGFAKEHLKALLCHDKDFFKLINHDLEKNKSD